MVSKYFLFLLVTGFCGCSVLQPVHETQVPETLGPWGFSLGTIGATAPTLATTIANNTDTNSYSMSLQGARMGIGLGRNFELDYDAYWGGAASAGNSIQLRWQILGNPIFESKSGGTDLIFAVRNSSGAAPGFTSSVITNSSYYSADLSSNSFDESLVLGHRFTDIFGGYIGAKNMSGSVSANYKGVQNGPTVSSQSRNFSAYGGLVGLYLSAIGTRAGFNVILEEEYMNMPSTYSGSTTWVSELSLSLSVPFHF